MFQSATQTMMEALNSSAWKLVSLWFSELQSEEFCLWGFYPVVICVQKERKLLQVKRLDLDAAKTRLKKARMADARAAVSTHTLTETHNTVNAALFFGFSHAV